MMKKNTSKDAQIARMQQLADVKGTRVHENRNSLGTLIDFKRGADKVAYGIVKENHQYFIKKANSQGNPNVEDFAYIGGQENITEYRYNKLSEADKNRNMLLLTINEALGGKEIVTKSGSKPSLLSEGEKPTFEKGVKPDFGKKKDKDEKKEEKDEEEKEGKKHEKKESPEFEKGEKEEEKEEAEEEKKEDVDEGIEDEIASAEEKLAGAEEKTAEEPDAEVAVEPEAPVEEPLDIDAIDVDAEAPVDGGEEEMSVDAEMPVDGGEEEMSVDAEMPVDGGEEEVVDTSLEGDPETADPEGSQLFQDSEEKRIIDSEIGKLAEKMGKEEFTDEEVESAVGRLLDPLKKEFAKMDIDTKKEIANENIIKIKPEEEGGQTPEDQLQMSDIEGQEDANMEMAEEKSCNECGFAKYAESRGYNAESLMECSVDEMASLMNGYAMEQDEMGDEDLESMAVFHSDELAECLKEEYANEELTTHLEPFVKKINEVEDTSKKKADTVKGMFWWQIEPQKEKDATLKTLTEEEVVSKYGGMSDEDLAALDENTLNELNELNFGGLKNVGSYLGNKAKSAVGNIGTGIKQGVQGAVQGITNAVTNKIEQVANSMDQMGTEISQQYQKGVKSTVEAKIQKAAQKFGEMVNKLDVASQKAGDGPINKQSVIMALQGILKGGAVAEGMDGNDPLNVQTQPMMEGEEEEIEVEKPEGGEEEVFDVTQHKEPEMNMTAGFETMGAGIPKPDGADVTSVEITKDAVNVTLSESEKKVRNYIRNRLEEMAGKRKPSLNEDKKSESLKKLDKMIASQVALFESVVEEGDFGKNIANFAGKMSQRIGGDIRRQRQLKQALPTIANDEHAISQWIRDIFSGGHVHKSAASYIGRATPEAKLDILTQVANDPNGVGMLQANQMGELVYKPVDHTTKIG